MNSEIKDNDIFVFSRQNSYHHNETIIELDKIFVGTELPENKLVFLRKNFEYIIEVLKRHKEYEILLLNYAKEFKNKFEEQKLAFDKFSLSLIETSEGLKLRNYFLKQNNLLQQYDERHEQLKSDLHCLKENKLMMNQEIDAMVSKKLNIIEDEDELHIIKDNLLKEIQLKKIEINKLKEDALNYQTGLEIKNKSIKELNEVYSSTKIKYCSLVHNPIKIAMDVDNLVTNEKDLSMQIISANKKVQQCREEILEVTSSVNQLNNERSTYISSLNKLDLDNLEENSKLMNVSKQVDLAKYHMEELKIAGTENEMNLNHINAEKLTLHKILKNRLNDKNTKLFTIKKMELQLKCLQDSMNILMQLKKRSELKLKDLKTNDLYNSEKFKDVLYKESRINELELKKQDNEIFQDGQKINQLKSENERLAFERFTIMQECRDLHKITEMKINEKNDSINELKDAQKSLSNATDEFKGAQLLIDEHKLRLRDLQICLEDFSKLYGLMKNERNKCSNLSISIVQKNTELKEKIKILENEVEILKFAHSHKDNQLSKERMKQMLVCVARDNIQNEIAKYKKILADMDNNNSQKLLEIKYCKDHLLQLKNERIKVENILKEQVNQRNERNSYLNLRKQEIINLSKDIQILEEACNKMNLSLSNLEEEIKFLRLKLNEEKRLLNIFKRKLPTKKVLSETLVSLQIELAQGYDYLRELEEKFINVDDAGRVRYLEGRDPSIQELVEKIKKLDMRLTNKEKEFLEKKLIFEQVIKLLDEVQNNVAQSKESSLALAKEMNHYQEKMEKKNHKLMALIAEYSMRKAQAMKLEEMMNEKEVELERCIINMQRGEAPSHQILIEWKKIAKEDSKINKIIEKPSVISQKMYVDCEGEDA